MGLFIISKEQLNNIKYRESLNYTIYNEGAEYISFITNKIVTEFSLFLQNVNKDAFTYLRRFNEKFKLCVPNLYFLVKVSKIQNIPEDRNLSHLSSDLQYRPILPYNKFYLFAMSKILASFYNSLLCIFPWVIGDTSGFLSWWHTHSYQCKTFYTADATNLYGSMPPKCVLSTLLLLFDLPHVKLFLNSDKPCLYQNDKSIEKILKYTDFVLNNTFCAIDNVIYKQDKGMPMGSPISPPLANLCLAYFEFIHFSNNPPFVRLLDDIASYLDIQTFTHIYPSYIQFNCEQNANKFLDVQICKDNSLKVYIKPFATLPPHVASRIPESMKKNYFTTQIKRAMRICDHNFHNFSEFLQWLTDEGLKKGYTKGRLIQYFEDSMSKLKFPIDDVSGFFIFSKQNMEKKDFIHVIQDIPSTININISNIIKNHSINLCDNLMFLRARVTDTNIHKICLKQSTKQ
jgi:hypothetical protein